MAENQRVFCKQVGAKKSESGKNGVEQRCRLQGRNRFLAIRAEGRRWAHPLVTLGGLPNHLDVTRCGFVASGKLGKAVVRNRIRRRLREAVRRYDRHISPGWDLVWIARPPILEADFQHITAAVEELLRQANIWRPAAQEQHGA